VFVRVETTITRYGASFTVSGWGLAAPEALLHAYERWTSRHYRGLTFEGPAHPDAVPAGSTLTNAEHFAFQVPLPGVAEEPALSGAPVITQANREIERFSFARRRDSTGPGIRYIPEESSDLETWDEIPAARLAISEIDENWEEVAVDTGLRPGPAKFRRVRVEPLAGSSGLFQQWPGYALAEDGNEDDMNADGIPDILDFAFDLGGVVRPYDKQRTGQVAGMPRLQPDLVTVPVVTFVRMNDSAQPGVRYLLEHRFGEAEWSGIDSALCEERIVRTSDEWEEVEVVIRRSLRPEDAHRVRIVPAPGGAE
jgi:hypothetical protein